MKINRRGADRDRGEDYVDLRESTASWDKATNTVEVRASRVRDFGFGASPSKYHNYRVVISLAEFADQLKEISKASQGANAAVISKSLRSSLPDLLRLALACASDNE